MKKILLSVHPFLGDACFLTAIIRDLHYWHKDKFRIGIDMPGFEDVFKYNPYIDFSLNKNNSDVKIRLQYNGHDDIASKGHNVIGFMRMLESKLGIEIPVTTPNCDIHLSKEEINKINPHGKYWVINAGYKENIITKHYPIENFQKVVDILKDKINFIQVGSDKDIHSPLNGILYNAIGKTSIRELILLIYNSSGVISPISSHAHLATMRGWEKRPSIIIAGGRECSQLIQYNSNFILNTIGKLKCCEQHGCLKRNDCLNFVPTKMGVAPKCMTMITPEEVADIIIFCNKYK